MKSNFRNLISAGLICGAAMLLPTGAWAADAAAGKALYAKCRSCHGPTGEGNPAMAKAMGVEIKPLSGASDDAIKNAVTKGAGKMKPVAGLAGADLDNLVAYVHTLK
ncbi:MAG: cytochrome c [Acidobacteriota bacterium]